MKITLILCSMEFDAQLMTSTVLCRCSTIVLNMYNTSALHTALCAYIIKDAVLSVVALLCTEQCTLQVL